MSQFILISKIVLIILVPLYFHVHSRIILYISSNNLGWDFGRNYMKLVYQFGENLYLYYLEPSNFLFLHLVTLLSLLSCGSFFGRFLGISYISQLCHLQMEEFYFFLSNTYAFYFLFCSFLIAQARTFSTMLNNSGQDSRHLLFVPSLGRKQSDFHH